eukprot:TRINITY_DN26204_c0_g1_i1.p1 TRINITY_DN26204_c0_g1~~TRINITY_DN26204_c0_g1_i1.p1  ORF type:complete len:406 (-),score=85.20 TRINITY_DN26204_c0_g1_i1:34-1251(-)
MAGGGEALAKAKLQLDFIPLADMARLASLEAAPPELELLTLQAAAGVLGLCSGVAQELAWEQLRPHLMDPAPLISKLSSYEPSGSALEVLEFFFRREDFRPECSAIASGPSSFAICSWCLGVYLSCGGSPPAPATEETLARLRADAQQSRGVKPVQPADSNDEEAGNQEQVEEADKASKNSAAIGGGLRILNISGEQVAVLAKAKAEWMRADLRNELKKSCPDFLGSTDDSVYSFLSGDVYLKGKTTLADLGLDPGTAEGAEIVAVAKPFTLNAEALTAFEAATDALNCINRASLMELASFSKPPKVCEDVVAAVYAIHYPKVDPSQFCWQRSKEMLRKPDFLKQSKDFDLKQDPERVVAALEPVMAQEHMSYDNAMRCSLASAGMFRWLEGILTCSRILSDAMQ